MKKKVTKNNQGRKEIPIGEVCTFRGSKYRCEVQPEGPHWCWECAFHRKNWRACELVECSKDYRSDKRDVQFVKIRKNGWKS